MNKEELYRITTFTRKGDIYRSLRDNVKDIYLLQSEIEHISITSVNMYIYLTNGFSFKVKRGNEEE